MNSFTSEAERNRVVGLRCSVKVPVCRSYTATPASTPAGSAAADGDGATDGEGEGEGEGDGPGERDGAGSPATQRAAGAWQPPSASSATSRRIRYRTPHAPCTWPLCRRYMSTA